MKYRLLLLSALIFVAADAPPATVSLKTVKYDELTAAVRQLHGKVVVVDFWANFCPPCKREFPHAVELHQKHGKDGLAVVSVALDQNTPANRAAVESFLKRQQATFANYLLDEPYPVWQAKLKIDGPPIVFVFNKKGELAQRFADEDVNYDKINALVASLLKE